MMLLTMSLRIIYLLISILIRNRQPSIPAKGACRNLHPWRSLAAFVLTVIHHAHHLFDRLALKAHCHYFFKAAIIFGIGFQNWIEYLIRRQSLRILLTRAQFGRGQFLEHRLWDNRLVAQHVTIHS